MSVQVSYKKQTLFFLILGIGILILIEGGARIYEIQINECNLIGKDAFNKIELSLQYQICNDLNSIKYEKKLINKMKPNQHFETININSYGFRGPEIIKEKSEDIFRIFIVGGSTAAGLGSISDQTTIPGFLQKKINESNIQLKVEVINAGIAAATSLSESEYIKNYLKDFEPDLIIIYDGANDARYKIPENGIAFDTVITESEITVLQTMKSFFGEFEFYRTPFAIYSFLIKNNIENTIIDPKMNDKQIDKIIELWENRITSICELGKKEGFSTMVALQPMIGSGEKILQGDELDFFTKTNGQLDSIKILKGMSEKLEKMEEKCSKTIDLRGVFDDVVEPIYFDDVHVVEFGNELVAQKLFEESVSFFKNPWPSIRIAF